MILSARTIFSTVLLLIIAGSVQGQDKVVIRGGTVIDVRTGTLTPNTIIVTEGGRISSVSTGQQVPAGGTVIDATGKFVMPGLIDLHAHYKEWAPELYLNHGVTTVVDLGNDHEWIKAQKDGILKGTIPGPRLFISSNNLDGTPRNPDAYFERPYVHLLDDPEDALKSMEQYVSAGVNAVKVYDGLSLEVMKALSRSAQKANIPLIGHFEDARIAAEVKANGIEHLNGIANTIRDNQAQEDALKKVRKGFIPPSESFMDVRRIPEVAQLLVKNNIFVNPTLRMSWQGDRALREKKFHYEDFDLTFNNWQLSYIPIQWKLANLKEYQEISLWHFNDLTPFEEGVFHRGYENSLKLVKSFSDAGGKLYSGTDCANMCVPGLGLHQELELIAESGIPLLKVLQAATINPAELMRMDKELGTIEEGYLADVLILDANPLENIRNTRAIDRVISRGKVLDGKYHADFRNPIPKNSWEDSSHFFPAPRIKWAAPEAFVSGATNVAIEVNGTGFIPYSVIEWAGRPLHTEFVSQFQIKATIPASELRPGTYAVTVANPDFAAGSIFASGASDLSHLGIRPHVSNQFLVLVKPPGGAPVFPHPRETAEK